MSKEPTDEAIAAAYAKLSDDEKTHIQSLSPLVQRAAMRSLVLSDMERAVQQTEILELLEKTVDSLSPEALDSFKSEDPDGFQGTIDLVKRYKNSKQFMNSLPQAEKERLKDIPVTQMAAFVEELMKEKGFNPDE